MNLDFQNIQSFIQVSPLNCLELLCAIFSGIIIGFERQLLGKPAGIRTSALICLSTYLFVAISRVMNDDYLRVVGQVVTGVGFLGGGVILSKEGTIQGMTSASVIWALSAIGVLIGLGYPVVGIKASLIIVVILYILDFFERRLPFLQKGVHRLKRNKRGVSEE